MSKKDMAIGYFTKKQERVGCRVLGTDFKAAGRVIIRNEHVCLIWRRGYLYRPDGSAQPVWMPGRLAVEDRNPENAGTTKPIVLWEVEMKKVGIDKLQRHLSAIRWEMNLPGLSDTQLNAVKTFVVGLKEIGG